MRHYIIRLLVLLLVALASTPAVYAAKTYQVEIHWYMQFGTHMVDHVVCRLDSGKLLVLHGAVGYFGWTNPRFGFYEAHRERGLVLDTVLLDLSNNTRRVPGGWVTEFKMAIDNRTLRIDDTVFNCVDQPDFNVNDTFARINITPVTNPAGNPANQVGDKVVLAALGAALGVAMIAIVVAVGVARG